jgi:hypothetical protein
MFHAPVTVTTHTQLVEEQYPPPGFEQILLFSMV